MDGIEPHPALETGEPKPAPDFIAHEGARDLAVAYVAQREGIEVPAGLWSSQDEPPEGLVGSSTFLYTNGPWVVRVSAPMVAPEHLKYTVVIDNLSGIFRWEGTVSASGEVLETNFVQGSMPTQGSASSEDSWIGVVVSNPPGSQFDDYFQMMDQYGTRAGIEGETDEISAQLISYRDTELLLQLSGVMHRDVPNAYGMQIRVTRIEFY